MNDETGLPYHVSVAAPSPPGVGLSIVIPVYRGAATIGRLVEQLAMLRPFGGMQIILVNDGSPDNSGEVCQELVRRAPVPLTYVEHARNFGEHNAVMTGLRHASGAYVITMDDDLQNPPAEVVRLYDHARLGNWDVVYTRYGVKQHAGWRNLGSRFANAVADRLLDKPKGLYLSSFRCMSAFVVQSHGTSRYSQRRISRGASAAPARPPLRRTPSSCGKPISTGRPSRSAAGSSCQNSTTSPRRGSSGRRGRSSGGETGSSRVDHAAPLDDAADMVDPEVIKQVAIIGDVADDQVGLLARLQRAEAVGPAQRGGCVER